jgi:hypothetical protein
MGLGNEIIMNAEGVIVYFEVMLSILKLTNIPEGVLIFITPQVNMIIKKENINIIMSVCNSDLKFVVVIKPEFHVPTSSIPYPIRCHVTSCLIRRTTGHTQLTTRT